MSLSPTPSRTAKRPPPVSHGTDDTRRQSTSPLPPAPKKQKNDDVSDQRRGSLGIPGIRTPVPQHRHQERQEQQQPQQQRQPENRLPPKERRRENKEKFPRIENRPDGSPGSLNHLKPFPGKVILPRWLSPEHSSEPRTIPSLIPPVPPVPGLTIVPPLPILSDPEGFFTIIAARTGTTIEEKEPKEPPARQQPSRKSLSRNTHPQTTATSSTGTDTRALSSPGPTTGPPSLSAPGTPSDLAPRAAQTKVFIRPEFSEPYKVMAFHGDRQLRYLCDRLVFQVWGISNRRLGKFISDDFQSNDCWIFLTIVYGLHVLVEVTPPEPQTIKGGKTGAGQGHRDWVIDATKDLTGNKQRRNTDYAMLKGLADIWEAYFNGVLTEREQLGDNILDIEAFFMTLLIRKYAGLLQFTQGADISKVAIPPSPPQVATRGPGYTVRKVVRMDKEIERELGPETARLGSLVTSSSKPSSSTRGATPPATRYNVVTQKAIQQLKYFEWDGLKRTPAPPIAS